MSRGKVKIWWIDDKVLNVGIGWVVWGEDENQFVYLFKMG